MIKYTDSGVNRNSDWGEEGQTVLAVHVTSGHHEMGQNYLLDFKDQMPPGKIDLTARAFFKK